MACATSHSPLAMSLKPEPAGSPRGAVCGNSAYDGDYYTCRWVGFTEPQNCYARAPVGHPAKKRPRSTRRMLRSIVAFKQQSFGISANRWVEGSPPRIGISPTGVLIFEEQRCGFKKHATGILPTANTIQSLCDLSRGEKSI